MCVLCVTARVHRLLVPQASVRWGDTRKSARYAFLSAIAHELHSGPPFACSEGSGCVELSCFISDIHSITLQCVQCAERIEDAGDVSVANENRGVQGLHPKRNIIRAPTTCSSHLKSAASRLPGVSVAGNRQTRTAHVDPRPFPRTYPPTTIPRRTLRITSKTYVSGGGEPPRPVVR